VAFVLQPINDVGGASNVGEIDGHTYVRKAASLAVVGGAGCSAGLPTVIKRRIPRV
jgi:hypothetical protein